MSEEKSQMDMTATQSPSMPEEKILDIDRMALEIATQKKLTALAEAKTALAQNENAELSFKYTVLQIYRKYNMSETDALDSATGKIVRNGNVAPPAGT